MQSIRKAWSKLSDNSLLSRGLEGGVVILAGEVYTNTLRLGSNLILTRLLYPEAFGQMLVVTLIFTAFGMFSDIGIKNAIIVRKQPADDEYLRTAWTLSVLRGILLAAMGVLSAQPIAAFYDDQMLYGLILIASTSPLVQGFSSLVPFLYEKQVRFSKVVLHGALSQTISTSITVVLVFFFPSIWTLALNGPIAALTLVLASYLMFSGFLPRFGWNSVIAKEIFVFGRWILIGTALTFMSRQGDALIVSRFTTAEQLGIFGIALTFSKLVELLVEKLSWTLLMPVYVELRERGITQFNASIRKIKLALYALCCPPLLLFSVFGRDLISLLYDPRYHSAGWMLEVLTVGALFFAAGGALINIPLAFADSVRHMWLQLFRFATLVPTLLIGASLGGFVGLIVSIPVAQALYYPVLIACTSKYGIRGYSIDVSFMALVGSVIAASWYLRGWGLPE